MVRWKYGIAGAVFCAALSVGSVTTSAQTLRSATWNGSTGTWSTTGSWSGLGGADAFPDNNATYIYNAFLPTAGGPYTLTVGSPTIDLNSLDIAADGTLLLSSSDFNPGPITNSGIIEIREDELLLRANVVNNGVIRFDTDTGGEFIRLTASSTISGSGALQFSDVGNTSISHNIYLENTAWVLTNAPGHTIEGGGGYIYHLTSGTAETFLNQGNVRANLANRVLRFQSNFSNRFQARNTGLMTAQNGGSLQFHSMNSFTNTGTMSCDAASSIVFNSMSSSSIGGTLNCDGLFHNESNAAVSFLDADGTGTGEYRQSSGGSVTFGIGTTASFATVDIRSGSITVQGPDAQNFGVVTVRDRYTHSLTTESAHNWNVTGCLRVTGGTPGTPAEIEVAGRDVGLDPANHVGDGTGFNNNFHLPYVSVAPGAHVRLVDKINNGHRCGQYGSAEAMYIKVVVFEDATGTLDINGLHLYYTSLNGNPAQIIDSGGQVAAGINTSWTCGTGAWETTGCWSALQAGDNYPNDHFVGSYQVNLPDLGGSAYSLTVNFAPIELCSLDLDNDATLNLAATDFNPGRLTNYGAVELRNDDLLLTTDVTNHGIIRFDTDTGGEFIQPQAAIALNGTGTLRFPDVGNTSQPHNIYLNDPNWILTNGVGHTIEGGGGIIYHLTSGTAQTFVNNGAVRANINGRALRFQSNFSNRFRVANNNLMAAENGGSLQFYSLSTLNSTGSMNCTNGSTIAFNSSPATIGGTVNCDGLLHNESNSTLTFQAAVGAGGGEYRQSSGGSVTFTTGTTVEFGTINLPSGTITVQNGGLATIRNQYTHNLTSPSAHNFNTTGGLRVTGGVAASPTQYDQFATVEIAGRDLGVDPNNHFGDPDGFNNNFALPRLIIAPDAKARLVDRVNNESRCSPGGSAEALYVDQLVFEDGDGLLDINGLHLYYNSLSGNINQGVNSGGQSSAGVASSWACANGNWGAFFCWDQLGPGDAYPNNFFTAAYQTFLPTGAGLPYTVTANTGPIEVCSLDISANATLRLDGTDFEPKALTNNGIVEIRNDDLLLTQDITNNGIIRFDTDANSEFVQVSARATLNGTGVLRFPEIGSGSTPHNIYINDPSYVLTNGPNHTIDGGGGFIYYLPSGTAETFINQGAVRANLSGRILRFQSNFSNRFRATNNNLMTAENSGSLQFYSMSTFTNNPAGVMTCSAGASLVFNSSPASIAGSLTCNGLFNNESNSTITFSGTTGTGVGEYRQSSGGSVTYTPGTTLALGIVDIRSGNITVQDGARVNVRDKYTHSLTTESSHNFGTTGALRVTGGSGGSVCNLSTLAQIEVAGTDLGTNHVTHVGAPAGFTNNFQISRLIIGPGAKVVLVDAINNGNRGGVGGSAEALYVNTLEFEDNTGRLVLNGLHLYYNVLTGSGTIGQIGLGADCNSNGSPDDCDIAGVTSNDCDGNTVPDECDVPPAGPPSNDCNTNGLPDACDIDDGTSLDCQSNGVPDECDVAPGGGSLDLNANDRPDECETDCNSNNVPDDQDISEGTSEDCNGNIFPDECEIDYDIYTWIGLDGGSFTRASNWDVGSVPGGDAVLTNHAAANNRAVLRTLGRKNICMLTVSATGAGKQILQIDNACELQATQGTTLGVGGELDLRGGTLTTTTIANAGNTIRGYGFVSGDVTNHGTIEASSGQSIMLTGDAFENSATGQMLAPVGSVLAVHAPSISQAGLIEARSTSAATFDAVVTNAGGGLISLLGGAVDAASFTNAVGADINGFGTIDGDTLNNGDWTVIADTQCVGNLQNEGTITIQNGLMTITGTLSGGGTVVGGLGGRGSGDGFAVLGDYGLAPGASVSLNGSAAVIGGDFDNAIDDWQRFDLSQAALQLDGMPAAGDVQFVEVASLDMGPCGVSLPDRTLFSIGELHIGPTHTTIVLVDQHDNAVGPGSEAIYASRVELETGITLDLAGRRIYYQTLVPADPYSPDSGVTVLDSVGGGGLIALGGAGDMNGDGAANGLDIASFVDAYFSGRTSPGGTAACSGDLDGDGQVAVTDAERLVAVLLGN